MKCKFCFQEMDDGLTVCPSCGRDNAEPEESCPCCGEPVAEPTEDLGGEEAAPVARKKIKAWQLVLVILGCTALLLSLSAVVYCSIIGVESFDEGIQSIVRLFTPRENDLFYKDSYTVSDKKAYAQKDVVVATVGGKELTNGELQIYYWMDVYDFLNNYSYYAAYIGLDCTKALDQQTCAEINGTWQQYFLDDALGVWHNYQAMANMAEAQNLKLSDELQQDLDGLRERLSASAVSNGFASIDAMLQADMGPGCTYEDYYSYMDVYYRGYMYFSTEYSKVEITDDMLEEYFSANQEALAEDKITKESGDYVDIRHILIEPEGGTKNEKGDTVYTDAEWEACRVKAQALLDEWLAGEHTEDTFAELANEHSADPGSNTAGGLYSDVVQGEMTENFDAWCFEEGRQAGDYGLVKTEFGYHIMYLSNREPQWVAVCRDALMSEKYAQIVETAIDAYPQEVNYKKIVLGLVDLSTSSSG